MIKLFYRENLFHLCKLQQAGDVDIAARLFISNLNWTKIQQSQWGHCVNCQLLISRSRAEEKLILNISAPAPAPVRPERPFEFKLNWADVNTKHGCVVRMAKQVGRQFLIRSKLEQNI